MPRDGKKARAGPAVAGAYNLGLAARRDRRSARTRLWSTRSSTNSTLMLRTGTSPTSAEISTSSGPVAYDRPGTSRTGTCQPGRSQGRRRSRGRPPVDVRPSPAICPRQPHREAHAGTNRVLRQRGPGAEGDLRRLRRSAHRSGNFETAQEAFLPPFSNHDGINVDRIIRLLVRREIKAESIGKHRLWPGPTAKASHGGGLGELHPLGDDTTFPNLGRYLSRAVSAAARSPAGISGGWRRRRPDRLPRVGRDLRSAPRYPCRHRCQPACRKPSPLGVPSAVPAPRTRIRPNQRLVARGLLRMLGIAEAARQFVASLELCDLTVPPDAEG